MLEQLTSQEGTQYKLNFAETNKHGFGSVGSRTGKQIFGFHPFHNFPFGGKSTRVVCVYVNTLDSWHYLNVLNTKCSGSAAPYVEYINGPLRKLSSGRAMLRALLPSSKHLKGLR